MKKHEKYILIIILLLIILFALFTFISKKYYSDPDWIRRSIMEKDKNWLIPAKIVHPINNKQWSWKWRD